MSILINYIRNSLRKDYSPIILVVGQQRRGKTTLALSLAYELEGEKFDADKQLFTGVEDMARNYKQFNGRVLIYDEVGVQLDKYRSMDIFNRVFSHIVATQAYLNNVLLMCLPHASNIPNEHAQNVKAVVHVYKRGAYKLYSCKSWEAGLNKQKIHQSIIEQVEGVPLPPKRILDFYKNVKEKTMKSTILDAELEKFAERNRKLQGRPADPDLVRNLVPIQQKPVTPSIAVN